MKTNEHIDVSDFFKRQLEEQAIEPPAHIWEQVQQTIPTYSSVQLWKKWWLYNSVALFVVVSAVFYWHSQQNTTNVPQGNTAKHISTNIQQRSAFVHEETKQTTYVDENNNAPKNKLNQTKNLKVQEAIYYVEASSVGILEKVDILDSLNQKRKTIQNIAPNEFGYYEFNIHDLKPGKYSIIFYKKDGKQIIRKEEFR